MSNSKFPSFMTKPPQKKPTETAPKEKYHHSSTSTLFLNSTITAPRNSELLESCTEWIRNSILPAEKCPNRNGPFSIFDEDQFPLSKKEIFDTKKVPSEKAVLSHIKNIFDIGALAPESLVMSISYLKKMKDAKFVLYSFNWRRTVLSAMILACKVWEEQAVWLIDFVDVFPEVKPPDLVQMEKRMLQILEYDVSLTAKEYAQAYFDLRAGSKTIGESFKSLTPLGKDDEKTLEIRTSKYTSEHVKKKKKDIARFHSHGEFENKSSKAILN